MAQNLVAAASREVETFLEKDLEDFVTFLVGGQLFGIPILKVQDILRLEDIAPIPLAPPRVMGSINLRGRIVTVVSVRVCLGIKDRGESVKTPKSPPEASKKEKTDMGVTVEYDHDLYTLLVDSIGEVVSVSSEFHEGNPSTLDASWREFALGVYRLEDRLMVVLDVERLLGFTGR